MNDQKFREVDGWLLRKKDFPAWIICNQEGMDFYVWTKHGWIEHNDDLDKDTVMYYNSFDCGISTVRNMYVHNCLELKYYLNRVILIKMTYGRAGARMDEIKDKIETKSWMLSRLGKDRSAFIICRHCVGGLPVSVWTNEGWKLNNSFLDRKIVMYYSSIINAISSIVELDAVNHLGARSHLDRIMIANMHENGGSKVWRC